MKGWVSFFIDKVYKTPDLCRFTGRRPTMTTERIIQYSKPNQNFSITLPPKLIGDLGWSEGDKITLAVRADTLELRMSRDQQ